MRLQFKKVAGIAGKTLGIQITRINASKLGRPMVIDMRMISERVLGSVN